ncbi:MAG: hypothetical protein Rubg2KO_40400 [Rubricoccaceae bacterium]
MPQLEAWLCGPLPDVPPLLQPVAHALVQARAEVASALADFPNAHLWDRPADVASVGFHLQHLSGVLDRLLTYARDEALTDRQLEALRAEGAQTNELTTRALVMAFEKQVDDALAQIRATNETTLLEPRGVGRKQIPSTVIGLLFHAAEHTTRHTGQLLVTARVVAKAPG